MAYFLCKPGRTAQAQQMSSGDNQRILAEAKKIHRELRQNLTEDCSQIL